MKTKKEKTLPGLPDGAPEGAFSLTMDEQQQFREYAAAQRALQQEGEKLSLVKTNLFLRLQIRTGQDVMQWGIDLQRGLCIPPTKDKPAETPKPSES